jgi:hypothetical protein
MSIIKRPLEGHTEYLNVKDKIVKTYRRSVRLSLFSAQYSIGYDNIAANYIVAKNKIIILHIYFT